MAKWRIKRLIQLAVAAVVVYSISTIYPYHRHNTEQWNELHRDTDVGFRHGIQDASVKESNGSKEKLTWDRQAMPTQPINATNATVTEETVSLEKLQEYHKNVSLPWIQNNTALDAMRLKLDMGLTAWIYFIVTQENTPAGSDLHFTAWPGRAAITEKIHALLPKKSPYSEKRISRCSVIGNSGILENSGCGAEIDKAEYVFRCNAAPIQRYSKDAGQKTNLTTINKSVLHDRYMAMKSLEHQFQFHNDMIEYNGLLWVPAYANRPYLDDCYNTRRTFKSEKSEIVFGHPHHYIEMSKYWATQGVHGILTTGFYLVSAALNLCEETHVFGFWPFLETPEGAKIKFHYYDDIGFTSRTKRIHEIPLEFELLYELHRRGILRMHIGKCH